MAANRQQGTYLGLFTAGFTALPAGLIGLVYDRPFVGAIVTIAALLVIGAALIRLRGIKALEFTKQ